MPRRARDEYEDDDRPRRKPAKNNTGLIIGLAVGGGVLLLLALAAVSVVWLSAHRRAPDARPDPAAPAATGPAAPHVSAPRVAAKPAEKREEVLPEPIDVGNGAKMFDTFIDNPIKAEREWVGKYIQILGPATVEKDHHGIYVSMDAGNYGFGSRPTPGYVAFIEKGQEDKFAEVRPGTLIVMRAVIRRWRHDVPGAYKGIQIEMDRATFVQFYRR